MPVARPNSAVRLDEKDMEVIVIGRRDDSKEAELKHKSVQALVAKICLLGQKRGSPRKEEESLDAAA